MISLPETYQKITEELKPEFNYLKEYIDKKIKLSPIRPGETLQIYTDASIMA